MKNEKIKLIEIKLYHDKEETKISEHYFVNENGEKHGTCKWYHENGNVEWERNYKDGELHGACKGYHENGNLKYEVNYKDGELHGTWKGYRKNGKLKWEWNYENGKLLNLNYFQLFKKWIKKLLNKNI